VAKADHCGARQNRRSQSCSTTPRALVSAAVSCRAHLRTSGQIEGSAIRRVKPAEPRDLDCDRKQSADYGRKSRAARFALGRRPVGASRRSMRVQPSRSDGWRRSTEASSSGPALTIAAAWVHRGAAQTRAKPRVHSKVGPRSSAESSTSRGATDSSTTWRSPRTSWNEHDDMVGFLTEVASRCTDSGQGCPNARHRTAPVLDLNSTAERGRAYTSGRGLIARPRGPSIRELPYCAAEPDRVGEERRWLVDRYGREVGRWVQVGSLLRR
jgi:hypothetical protein